MGKFNSFSPIAIIIVMLTYIIALLVFPYLPDYMPSHWNDEGQIDSFMPKFPGVFLVPLISLVLLGLFVALPKIDPLAKNYGKFGRYYELLVIVFMLFNLYIFLIILGRAFGLYIDLPYAMIPGLSVLFYLLGDILRKSKRNWFIGIRTPWTMHNDYVWDKTHERAGVFFKASALVMLFGMLFPRYELYFIMGPLIASAAYLFVYSYFVYKKEKRKRK